MPTPAPTVSAPPPPAPAAPPAVPHPRRFPALRHVGPNWYASVMGTAIVAISGSALPWSTPPAPVARAFFVAVWILSALMLAAVSAARAGHWIHHRDQARAHLLDPAVAPFYGCLAMALLSVGGATLAVGGPVIGGGAAVAVAAAAGSIVFSVSRQPPPAWLSSSCAALTFLMCASSASCQPLRIFAFSVARWV